MTRVNIARMHVRFMYDRIEYPVPLPDTDTAKLVMRAFATAGWGNCEIIDLKEDDLTTLVEFEEPKSKAIAELNEWIDSNASAFDDRVSENDRYVEEYIGCLVD